ncbi:riboflavin biosynthesis protein RibF, partial [Candidatus Pelagibacter sp.]|nr:riboflavin biosynthesis protein RibF [Candidatus Pelagibacter sp.]
MQKGKLEKANKILNRNWSIYGKVQKGKQLGKKIGFPTANIDIKDYILACPGVYAVRAKKVNENNYL